MLDSKIQESSIKFNYFIEPQLGIPFARNTVCRESMNRKADWILFLDDDEEADPGWLEAYQKASETMEADVYTSSVCYISPVGYADWLENKGISKTPDGSLLKRASTNNVMFPSWLLMNPHILIRKWLPPVKATLVFFAYGPSRMVYRFCKGCGCF